jgi:hypothetical protein
VKGLLNMCVLAELRHPTGHPGVESVVAVNISRGLPDMSEAKPSKAPDLLGAKPISVSEASSSRGHDLLGVKPIGEAVKLPEQHGSSFRGGGL